MTRTEPEARKRLLPCVRGGTLVVGHGIAAAFRPANSLRGEGRRSEMGEPTNFPRSDFRGREVWEREKFFMAFKVISTRVNGGRDGRAA